MVQFISNFIIITINTFTLIVIFINILILIVVIRIMISKVVSSSFVSELIVGADHIRDLYCDALNWPKNSSTQSILDSIFLDAIEVKRCWGKQRLYSPKLDAAPKISLKSTRSAANLAISNWPRSTPPLRCLNFWQKKKGIVLRCF